MSFTASSSIGDMQSLIGATQVAATVVIRVSIPSLNIQKALKVNTGDSVWTLKKQLIDKCFTETRKDLWNYGIFLHGKDGKQGKFLNEYNTLIGYGIETTVRNHYKHNKNIMRHYNRFYTRRETNFITICDVYSHNWISCSNSVQVQTQIQRGKRS